MHKYDGRFGRKIEGMDLSEFDGEILYDEEGTAYELSEEHRQFEISKRTASVDEEIELNLAKELLNSNLKRLTNNQRDVLYYTMFRYSQDDMASKMGISVSAVRKHLESAKKKLAKIITGTKQILKEGLENGRKATDTTDNQD